MPENIPQNLGGQTDLVNIWIADRPDHSGFCSAEHTSELQSLTNLVCRLLLEKKKHGTITLSKTTPTKQKK